MSGYNLPGNWGAYSRTCTLCNDTYHASGTVQCSCLDCPICGDTFYCDNPEEQDSLCDPCWSNRLDELADEADLEYEDDDG